MFANLSNGNETELAFPDRHGYVTHTCIETLPRGGSSGNGGCGGGGSGRGNPDGIRSLPRRPQQQQTFHPHPRSVHFQPTSPTSSSTSSCSSKLPPHQHRIAASSRVRNSQLGLITGLPFEDKFCKCNMAPCTKKKSHFSFFVFFLSLAAISPPSKKVGN